MPPILGSRWIAAAIAAAAILFSAAGAQAETRTLKLHFIHTKESADITYKRNGRYVQSGINEINRFLRDWRRNEPAKMSPQLLDVLWEVYQASGARDRIHVVSAYRSPATNSMLRSRSNGVAKNSQHMLGKAIDFYIPGVKLATLRALGLKMQAGGVGYYPRSGSPFVHLDVGNVRHWPRMSRGELMAVFPKGDTIHVPSDGKPLPNYKLALAAYEQRKRSGGTVQIASSSGSRSGGGLLANLFGGGADEEEDNAESGTVVAAPARRQPAAPVQAAPPPAVPAAPVAPAAPVVETPETIIASLPARAVPLPGLAPRPSAEVPAAQPAAPVAVAAVDPRLPESLPFGVGPSVTAPAAAPAQESSPALEMAMNIPLPTARPSTETAAGSAQAAATEQAKEPTAAEAQLLAAMAARPDARTPEQAAFGGAPGQASPLDSVQVAAYAPIPAARPTFPGAATMPAARPEIAAVAEIPVTKRLAPALDGNAAMITAAAAAPASPRVAMLSVEESQDRVRRITEGAKTTAKGARPTAVDARPDPKAQVVPLPRNITRWALDEKYVIEPKTAAEPADANEVVRKAPAVVYAGGFQQGPVADPNRFTGKAVTFMPIARFETN